MTKPNVLTILKEQFPQAYTLLCRPALGQGGFQSRLRTIQADLGITPDPIADVTTPARYVEVAGKPNPLPTTEQALSREQMILNTARGLQAIGKVAEANRLLAELLVGSPNVQDERSEEETDDDAINVADLDAVLSKARKVRQEKAILRAAGRSRKSPKLTAGSKAKRSYRMFLLHHDPKGAARKMREKFGAEWKTLIKG